MIQIDPTLVCSRCFKPITKRQRDKCKRAKEPVLCEDCKGLKPLAIEITDTPEVVAEKVKEWKSVLMNGKMGK